MAYPYQTVVVNNFATTTSGDISLYATPENVIEDRPFQRRFYNFNMVITKPFTLNNISRLIITDDNGVDNYLLIDRLGKPVIAEELENYASFRRCIACQFDSVQKTVRVLSCMCPTEKYIDEWLDPTTSKDPVEVVIPAKP